MAAEGEYPVVTGYSRQDVQRILRIRASQFSAWERSSLIPQREIYSFPEMVQLRKLRDLTASHISAARIRASVDAMQSVSGMAEPLLEAEAVSTGSRLAFRLSEGVVDPITGQFVFDFDRPRRGISEVGNAAGVHASRDSRIGGLFLEAIQQEEHGGTAEAAALYEQILSIDPAHAPACINLGTICYNQRQFELSAELYRRATVADPSYALAYFDLGNVLDELKRLPDAIEAYKQAIRLVPTYADAHYNLALALERSGEPRKALRHWTAYVKLDPVGPWANHARMQLRRTLARETLAIVYRGSVRRPKTALGQPKPFLQRSS